MEFHTIDRVSRVEIIAEGSATCTANYQLEVTVPGSGNRSITGGKATIVPGAPRTIATVALGPSSSARTMAKLHVEPCTGVPYDETWPPETKQEPTRSD